MSLATSPILCKPPKKAKIKFSVRRFLNANNPKRSAKLMLGLTLFKINFYPSFFNR